MCVISRSGGSEGKGSRAHTPAGEYRADGRWRVEIERWESGELRLKIRGKKESRGKWGKVKVGSERAGDRGRKGKKEKGACDDEAWHFRCGRCHDEVNLFFLCLFFFYYCFFVTSLKILLCSRFFSLSSL
jgi:hypothetical protein